MGFLLLIIFVVVGYYLERPRPIQAFWIAITAAVIVGTGAYILSSEATILGQDGSRYYAPTALAINFVIQFALACVATAIGYWIGAGARQRENAAKQHEPPADQD